MRSSEDYAFAIAALVLAAACSATDSSSKQPPGADGAAAAGGSVGGADGSGGSAAGGGWPTAGNGGSGGSAAAQATDAGDDADGDAATPFVCDGSGPLDCSASEATTYTCGDPSPNLATTAKNAVELVLAQHPEWFDASTGFACCPLALQPASFVQAVVDAINQDGACAQIDPNNPSIEIVVKTNNKCSEQYVLLTSANVVRNPPKFQGACVPAWL